MLNSAQTKKMCLSRLCAYVRHVLDIAMASTHARTTNEVDSATWFAHVGAVFAEMIRSVDVADLASSLVLCWSSHTKVLA